MSPLPLVDDVTSSPLASPVGCGDAAPHALWMLVRRAHAEA